ncbi:MAG: hypothetical protein R3C39_14060 [Dehalococcoidia bacterium]
MTFRVLVRWATVAVLGLALVACSSDSDDGDATTEATSGGEAAMTETAAAMTETAAASSGGGGDAGHATLTIGDSTWEFDSFSCAFGHDATQSDVYAFSSDARGVDPSGSNVQFQVNVRDESGEGRFEGDGVVYEVDLQDISDFSDPKVGWSGTNGRASALGGGVVTVTIDGDHVTASGGFDNTLTDAEFESVDGTLDATCGAQSRR